MELLGVILYPSEQEMRDAERVIHKRFAEYNTKGEWFSWGDEIEVYIQAHFDKELGERILKDDHECLIEHNREYRARPEVKKRERERQREYNARPEVKKHSQERRLKYRARPEVKKRRREQQRKYNACPEVRQRKREYMRKYRARKKRENQQINGQQLSFF